MIVVAFPITICSSSIQAQSLMDSTICSYMIDLFYPVVSSVGSRVRLPDLNPSFAT